MIDRSTDVGAALRCRHRRELFLAGRRESQRGFVIDPYRFSSGPLTDPNLANVVLNLNGVDADTTTTFTDVSPTPKTVARTGTHISNVAADAKFGTTGITATSAKDSRLTAGAAADFKFLNGLNVFTIEAWLKYGSFTTTQVIIDTAGATTANIGLYIAVLATTRLINVQGYFGSVGNFWITQSFGTAWPNDSSYHFLQITYDPALGTAQMVCVIDGGASSTMSKTGNTPSSSNPSFPLSIGAYNHATTPAQFMQGSIGHLRLTKDVARAFAVPGAAFPTI